MSVKLILEDLENIAASIASQSQTFQNDPDSTGGDLLQRGMDSLDLVDYLMAIEDKYGFRVSEKDLQMHDLSNTDNMAQFLFQKTNIKSSPLPSK